MMSGALGRCVGYEAKVPCTVPELISLLYPPTALC